MSRFVTLLLLVGAVVLVVRALRRSHPQVRAGRDPWEVLGVRRGASREEIARGYRERLKEYHPDRVAQLGAELRELAHRKTLEIREAYDALTRGR